MTHRLILASGAWLLGAGTAAAIAAQTAPPPATFVTRHEWAGRGQWLRADTHIHTRFTDGGATVQDVAARALQYGCDAIAITDHASRGWNGATDEYFQAIRAARVAHPSLLILAGVEWNIPPYGSREHVSVLVPESPAEAATLMEFKQRFDDYDRVDGTKPTAGEALAWLATNATVAGVKPVVVYNHPSRKDNSSRDNIADLEQWRTANDLFIGFEGGPGHQGKPPYGSYEGKEQVIDRWDPVVARIGDAWDTLLQRGMNVSGALATADFDNDSPNSLADFWPCQFAETWYYAPERTPQGLLRAMRAGTFFGVHGHIAREVMLTATAAGLPRAAIAGEQISVPAGTTVTASLHVNVPATDWQGQANNLDAIEFIVVRPNEVAVRTKPVIGTGPQSMSESILAGPGDVVVRARGRRVVPDGPDLMFYTNAIRISAR